MGPPVAPTNQELLLLPNGELLRPADENGRKWALDSGAIPASQEQERGDVLKKQYSSWLYAPEAAALGVAQGVSPGAISAVTGGLRGLDTMFGSHQADQTQDFMQGVLAAHPDMAFYGQIAGAGAGGAASGAMNLVKQVGVAALAGAAISADQLALEHAQSPEGGEKLVATLGTGAMVGMFLHGAGTVAAGALSPVLKSTAKSLINKGSDMTLAATLPEGAQEWLQSRASLAKAQSYLVDNDLIGKSQPEILAHLSAAEESTHSIIQEARGATKEQIMGPEEKDSLARLLQNQLPPSPARSKATVLFNANKPANLEQLHNLRMEISKGINWKDPSSQYSQRLMNGRETVAGAIDSLFSGSTATPELEEQYQRFAQANAEFSTIQDLKSAFKAGGKAASPTWSLNTIRTVMRGIGTGLQAAGSFGLGPVAYGTGTVLKKVASAAGSAEKVATALGTSTEGLGRFIQTFDEKVVRTVQNGLSGTFVGGSKESAGKALVQLPDYGNVAMMLHLMNQNPQTAVPRLSEVLQSHGVPGPVADLTATRTAPIMVQLGAQVPVNPFIGRVVAPIHWQTTLKEKAALLDKVNTILDPLSALRTPTTQKLMLLQQVYPELTTRVQMIVAQEAAARPGLSRPGRQWASSITGIANSPINSPEAQATLRQLDAQETARTQQMQQQAQQAQQKRSGLPQKSQQQTGYQRLMK